MVRSINARWRIRLIGLLLMLMVYEPSPTMSLRQPVLRLPEEVVPREPQAVLSTIDELPAFVRKQWRERSMSLNDDAVEDSIQPAALTQASVVLAVATARCFFISATVSSSPC